MTQRRDSPDARSDAIAWVVAVAILGPIGLLVLLVILHIAGTPDVLFGVAVLLACIAVLLICIFVRLGSIRQAIRDSKAESQ